MDSQEPESFKSLCIMGLKVIIAYVIIIGLLYILMGNHKNAIIRSGNHKYKTLDIGE